MTRSLSPNARFALVLVLLAAAAAFARPPSRASDYLHQDSARFRVFYCPEDAQLVAGFLSDLRAAVPSVERPLGIALADTVTFVVTPSEEEWYRLTEGAPLWANGLAFAERGVAILKSPRFGQPYGPLPATALHEYVHLLLHAGAPEASIPRWLDEGLAQLLAGQARYMEDAVVARAAAAQRLHTFFQIESLMAMSALEARQGYAESAIAVQLLQAQFGMPGIANLIHELRRGRSFEETFATVFGQSPGSFEAEYLAYVQRNYRVTLLADTELWVSVAFVVLVGAAGVVVWLRRRRTLARWKEEDHRTGPGAGTVPPFTVNYTLVRGRLHEQPGPSEGEHPHDEPMPGN